MIALIIKGSPSNARAAMNERAIAWNDSFVSVAGGKETLARCGIEHFAAIANWFAETALDKAPFPNGTLLLYTNMETSDA